MFQNLTIYCIFLVFIFSCNQNKEKQTTIEDKFIKTSIIFNDSLLQNQEILKERNVVIKNTLSQKLPIILLNNLPENEQKAQQLAINNTIFTENIFDLKTGQPLLNEIFNVYEARPQELTEGNQPKNIYKVELYNFALNYTTTAFVNIKTKTVFNITKSPKTQPEIPTHLKELAVKIATKSPEVINALGYNPKEAEVLMANTKTALNQTYCERSMHLCVAPTFTIGNKALWAIVDLTDQKLVGIRWTNTGNGETIKRVSERRLKFDKIMECYCKKINNYSQKNWKFNFVITNSDGLRVSEIYFNNKLIINNIKVVDWHVSYSNTDGFGYSDAVGCPEFSQAAVVAVSEPFFKDILENGKKIGFSINQNFSSQQWPLPCNYNYLQSYEFYFDGRFRPIAASLGRGCGNNGTYRPVTRIAFTGNQIISEWKNKNWLKWQTEQWKLQNALTEYTLEGHQYKINDSAGNGFYLTANQGKFNDDGRNDNAYVYATKVHLDKDEGEKDMISIGPCCNNDYHQGPEKFIEPKPENLDNSDLVIWYVAQMKNDDTKGNEFCWAESYLQNGIYKTRVFPGKSGPMFVPIKK